MCTTVVSKIVEEKILKLFKDPRPVGVPETPTSAQHVRYYGNPCKALNHHYHHAQATQGSIFRIPSTNILEGPGLVMSRLREVPEL